MCNFLNGKVRYFGRLVLADDNSAGVRNLKQTIPASPRNCKSFSAITDGTFKISHIQQTLIWPNCWIRQCQTVAQQLINWSVTWPLEDIDFANCNCPIRSPMVVFPYFAKPFLLDKNSSNKSLGAVSYQVQPSPTTPVEKRYHMQAGKLEFLVLNCAVTER